MIKNLLSNKEDKLEMVIPLDYYNQVFSYIKPDIYRIVKNKESRREFIYILLSKAELDTNTKTVTIEFKGTRPNDKDKLGEFTLNLTIESILTMLANKENVDADTILFYGYLNNDKAGFYMDLLKEVFRK